jgi:hypothetical protein
MHNFLDPWSALNFMPSTRITTYPPPANQTTAFLSRTTLENHTLGLLDILDVRVLDHEHENQHQTGERDTSGKHASMSVPIRKLNSKPLLTADRITELRRQTGGDQRDLILCRSRQVPCERAREDVGPDRTGDGGSDGAAEGS